MRSFIVKKSNKIVYTLILIGLIFLIIAIKNYLIKLKIYYQPKANICGCTPGGPCSENGSYCENFHHCEGNDPIIEVYICSNGTWTYAYPQQGGYCSFSQCGATPIPAPTSSGHPCTGGVFNVIFKTNRPLQQNESINCQINGQGNCAYGFPCDGANKERSCSIGPGLSQCGVSGLDCTCKPFSYSCTGSASVNGTFENVTNAGSETVNISLPPPPSPTSPPQATNTPTPTPTSPPPTNSPTPTSTSTPTPTPTSPPQATNTPTPTTTPTPTSTPTPTPTPTPTSTTTPTNAPSLSPQATNTPKPTATPTRIPTSAPTQTPTPTEIILVQNTNTPTPTQEITVSPTIPSSGRISLLYFVISVSIILLSLIL